MGNTIKIIREALGSIFGEKPNETAEIIPTIIIQDAPVRFSTLERASSPVQSNTTGYSAGYSTASSTNTSQGNRSGHTTASSTNTSQGNRTGHTTASLTSTSQGNRAGHMTASSTNTLQGNRSGHTTVSSTNTLQGNRAGHTTASSTNTSQGNRAGHTTASSTNTSQENRAGHTTTNHSNGISADYSTQSPTNYWAGNSTANSLVTANDYDSDDEDTDGTFDDSEEEFEEENLVEFYHYTDYAGICAIQSSGYIKESSEYTMYAQHGKGVYGTNMAPCEGKLAISINNWNNGGYARMRRGRADYAVCLLIPESKVKDCSTRRRDLLLHKGRIFLSDYEHEIVCVEHE